MPLSKIPAVGVDATGTPSSTTFFRGDNTWATISGGLGDGQTWQAVTRTAGTTYTNTTGRPIALNFCSSGGVSVTIAGVTSFGGGTQVQTYIIPTGATYILSATPTVNTNELR
jgi:hypothetical protein